MMQRAIKSDSPAIGIFHKPLRSAVLAWENIISVDMVMIVCLLRQAR
jgi:hypothetical protein